MYMQRTTRNQSYGLLRSVPYAASCGVFYQGPCPAKNATRSDVCTCGCGCETPLDPCPRYAGVCADADCLAEVTASANCDCDCGCNCNCGCGCDSCNSSNCGCGNCNCSNSNCNCGCGNSNCGCDNSNGNCASTCADYYAMLTAQGPATLQDGGSVPFTLVSGSTSSFQTCQGGVQFLQNGTYFVNYTINAPAGSQANAVMGLRLNGTRLSQSEVPVQIAAGAGATSFSGQTVVQACAGDCLSLVSNGPATFPQGSLATPLFTMTVVRISP